MINVDLKSVFFLAQAFARRALARGGGAKIVNVASVLAFTGGIRVPSYTASKHGVAGLTKLLANEWAAKGINVNAIAPGYVRTDATQALQDDPVRSERLLVADSGRPLGRACRYRRRRGIPVLPGLGLLPWHYPCSGWRLARGLILHREYRQRGTPLRTWLGRIWLTAMVLLAAIDIAAAQPKRILLLHSFGPNFGPWNVISARLREELRTQSPAHNRPLRKLAAGRAIRRPRR